MFAFKPRRSFFVALSTAVLMTIAGCGEKELDFMGSDISGTKLGQGLAMVDTQGNTRKLEDFHGKVVVVFFGFTQCPDVCPTSMAELSETMNILGEDAKDVQVVMVTVDPERDTPEILSAYVNAFDPRFVGLTGTPEQLAETAKSFKAFYAKVPGPTPEQYSMDHAASYYIFDKNGEVRVLVSNNASADAIAHDIRQLL